MNENKKSKGRKSYLNDFKLNDSGSYSFQGYYYEWTAPPDRQKVIFFRMWILSVAAVAASIVAGCVPNPWVNVPYALIPYVLSLVVIISLLWGMIRFTMEGNRQRSYVYEKSTSNLHMRALFSGIFSLAAIVGDIIAVFASGIHETPAVSLIFILPELIALICLLLYFRLHRSLIWEKKA